MHILLGLIAIIGGIVFWIWRIRNAATVAREVVDVAGDVQAAVRRFGYRRHADKHPLDVVEDPRLAAAGILAAIAKMDGDYTREQIMTIQNECARVFEATPKDAEDFASYGRWLAQQLSNPDEVVRRLSRGLSGTLGPAERAQFLEMVERVAVVEGGGVSDPQRLAHKQLSETLG